MSNLSNKHHQTLANHPPVTQDAFSLIEVIVAVGLISVILTGLSLTLLYTARTVEDTRQSSLATDQAQSCLNTFRNLRDSNSWPTFCSRLNSVALAQDQTEIVWNNGSEQIIICPANPGTTYTLSLTNIAGTNSPCTGSPETAQINIGVDYNNFSGEIKNVSLGQSFTQLNIDAPYNN